MNISPLLNYKNNRTSFRFKARVVERYRAELLEAADIKQHLNISWAELRRLNRWYFRRRLQRHIFPKLRFKHMKKQDSAYIKELERKLAEAEKHNQHLRLKAEAYEIAIQIAEDQFNIPILKKSGAKRSKS